MDMSDYYLYPEFYSVSVHIGYFLVRVEPFSTWVTIF